MSQNKWDESFLRTVAALQAQISLINAEADQLTDLGDMQAQRKLKADAAKQPVFSPEVLK